MLVDSSGYIILHPDLMDATETETPNFAHVHLTVTEAKLSYNLIQSDVLLEQHCLDHQERREIPFWIVSAFQIYRIKYNELNTNIRLWFHTCFP